MQFKRTDVFRFINRNYSTNEMVIASVGDIQFEKIVRLAEKYFGAIKFTDYTGRRDPYNNYKSTKRTENKESYLTHAIIGNLAYSRRHPERIPLALITNLLGGPVLNSRLNLTIREKYGYAYNIEANYQPYSDTGVFSVYIGSDRNHIEKSLKLVGDEFRKLRDKKLGTIQLQRAKKQIAGQLAIGLESRLNEMLSMAKNHLYDSRVKTIDEVMQEVEDITAEEIIEVSNHILNPDQLSTLVYKAREE
jgi:predicted Zn-dependent peptidase